MGRLFGFWLLLLPVWLWALLLLWVSSSGVIDVVEGALLLFAAVPGALIWIIGGGICVQAEKFSLLLMWLSAPVVCIASLALSTTDIPMIGRFHLSEPALRQYAETGPSENLADTNAQIIGLFNVDRVWRHGRTVAFATDGKPFLIAGVIYAPDGLPTELPTEMTELLFARYTHISGPWYRFETGD